MQSPSILTPLEASDSFSRRQVIPLSEAVRPVRFARRQWEVSQQAREVLDSFDLPLRPAPRPVADPLPCESIIMEGAEIRRTMRTGSFEVRQNSTASIELDDTPAPLAFETVADTSIQSAAAVALQQLNDRPHARRSHRLNRPTPKPSRATRPDWIATVIVLGGLAIAALVAVTRGSLI